MVSGVKYVIRIQVEHHNLLVPSDTIDVYAVDGRQQVPLVLTTITMPMTQLLAWAYKFKVMGK